MSITIKTTRPSEIFCAHVLHDYVLSSDSIIVGDDSKLHLPDIYNTVHTLGIEVVQIDEDVDLDLKKIVNESEKYDFDYDSVLNFCNEQYPNKYYLHENHKKVASITPLPDRDKNGVEIIHQTGYMQQKYKKELHKKLQKLNKGNYSGVSTEIDLCISIVQRLKTRDDALLILYVYCNLIKREEFQKTFRRIFVITSQEVFTLLPENVKKIKYENFNFSIQGERYIESKPYDFERCHKYAFNIS